ncbi:DinB family protein [Catellatospora tritici]|uniref:DinB family protein n=1 Tax=Catellatospora tritici TaxID=2851566 RepID=UPI001C2D9363|nr:DinB family protein [Catellatospora tritici]MBV1854889.1 DinB family protein [Catellatospora tritici]
MSQARIRPDYTADERTQLLGWLQMQRDIIAWKCEGLSDVDAYRPVLPASPLMTMAGLLAHLRWTEHCWFEVILLGRGAELNPQFDQDGEDLDMKVEGVPLSQLVADYRAQCAASDEIIAAHSLDDTGRHSDYKASAASVRWILLHMIEETARHAGHADAIRELADGQIGYY